MVFRLAIPFASGSTALNLYGAITIPMPTNDTNGYASQYETEAEYVAIAESTRRIALLSQPEIDACIGSSSFSVCTNGFSLETAEDTCLGALLIGNQFAALQNCNINTVKLPVKEKAKNLGNGKWLITSASDQFDMFMSEMRNNDPLKRKRLPGCKTCVTELECGTKIETRFMEIRADIFSCRNDTAIRIDVNLTDPLQHLFSKIPSLNEMPHISTITQAREQMIEKVQLKLATVPDYHRKSFQKLDKLTEPIILDMTTIRPSLRNRFTASSTWHITNLIGFISFLFSIGLQFLSGYLCTKYKKYQNPMLIIFGTQKVTARPVLVVSEAEMQILKLQNDEEFMRRNFVLNEQIFNERILPMAPKYEGPSTNTVSSLCEQIALQLKNN